LYFIGEVARVISLENVGEVDNDIAARLMQLLPQIKEVFKACMGETLLFIDHGKITFAAFSHYLKTAQSDARFKVVMNEGVQQRAYARCANKNGQSVGIDASREQ
jgi:hypothetical protein